MKQLTKFQRDLMLVISAEDGQKGLGLKEELQKYYDGDIHHGRLYPNLDKLVELGYVEKGKIDDRSNSYTLTEAGHDAIEERQEWVNRMIAGDIEPDIMSEVE